MNIACRLGVLGLPLVLLPATASAQEAPPFVTFDPMYGWAAPPAPFALPPPPPAPRFNASGVVLGIDVGGAYSLGSPNGNLGGAGVDFRVGYRFPVGPLWIAPQATIGEVVFPAFDSAVRFGLGGQIGVASGVVEPSVYAFGGGFWNVWKTGTGLRAGAALDFRLRQTFVLGVHADYTEASWDTGSLRYVSPGLHVGWVIR